MTDDEALVSVSVDLGKCVSHAVCVGLSPDIFELRRQGSWDELTIHGQHATRDRLALLQEAVRSCPEQALSIDDSPSK
jgi:ferredoxin